MKMMMNQTEITWIVGKEESQEKKWEGYTEIWAKDKFLTSLISN